VLEFVSTIAVVFVRGRRKHREVFFFLLDDGLLAAFVLFLGQIVALTPPIGHLDEPFLNVLLHKRFEEELHRLVPILVDQNQITCLLGQYCTDIYIQIVLSDFLLKLDELFVDLTRFEVVVDCFQAGERILLHCELVHSRNYLSR